MLLGSCPGCRSRHRRLSCNRAACLRPPSRSQHGHSPRTTQFPEFDDSLLTAVELTARPPDSERLQSDTAGVHLPQTASRFPLARCDCARSSTHAPCVRRSSRPFCLPQPPGLFRAFAPQALFAVWFRRARYFMSNELWPRRTILTVDGFPGGVARVAKGRRLHRSWPRPTRWHNSSRGPCPNRLSPGRLTSARRDHDSRGARQKLDATVIKHILIPFRGVLSPIDLSSSRRRRVHSQTSVSKSSMLPRSYSLDAECRYPDYMGRNATHNSRRRGRSHPEGHGGHRSKLEANKRLTEVQNQVDGRA